MTKVLVKRGTRAQIDAAAAASGLNQGEIYLVTDEDRLAVGKNTTTVVTIASLADAGGLTRGSGNATLDFGTGSNEASVVVTGQSGILANSQVFLTVPADAVSASHSANDHKYFLQLCSLTNDTPTVNSGFTIYARSVHKLTGTWTVSFSWIQ
jgi:hypothetical protein